MLPKHLKQLIEVKDLGDTGWTTLNDAFKGCSNLASFTGGITDSVTDMSGMFDSAINMKTADLSSFNTENVSDMSFMFHQTFALKELDLTNFDTSKVEKMVSMFENVKGIPTIDFTSFVTTSVTDMTRMFRRASGFTLLDLSNRLPVVILAIAVLRNEVALANDSEGNGSKTSPFRGNGASLKKLNRRRRLSSCWRERLGRGPSHFLASRSGATSKFGPNFDTSNVTTMYDMFNAAAALKSLDVSGFNTAEVTDMSGMFGGVRS